MYCAGARHGLQLARLTTSNNKPRWAPLGSSAEARTSVLPPQLATQPCFQQARSVGPVTGPPATGDAPFPDWDSSTLRPGTQPRAVSASNSVILPAIPPKHSGAGMVWAPGRSV